MKTLLERICGQFGGSTESVDANAVSQDPISSVESLGEQLLKDTKEALGMARTAGHVGLINSIVARLRHDSTD